MAGPVVAEGWEPIPSEPDVAAALMPPGRRLLRWYIRRHQKHHHARCPAAAGIHPGPSWQQHGRQPVSARPLAAGARDQCGAGASRVGPFLGTQHATLHPEAHHAHAARSEGGADTHRARRRRHEASCGGVFGLRWRDTAALSTGLMKPLQKFRRARGAKRARRARPGHCALAARLCEA